jgi:hypothetical protein
MAALLAIAPCVLAGPAEILRAAAQADASSEDLTAWKDLPDEESVSALLAALVGEDVNLALFAVENLDQNELTLAELRLAGRLVTGHPERWLGPNGDRRRVPVNMLGVTEVPLFWETVVEKGLDCGPGKRLDTHRPIVPEHLPRLVALLPRAKPMTLGWLTQLIATGADGIDRHRHVVARGLLYAHARTEEENGGPIAPALKESRIVIPATGLPEAFRKLAGVAWDLEPLRSGRDPTHRYSSPRWIRRWSRELTPAPADLLWLVTAVEKAGEEPDRVAAVRLIGKLSTDAATKVLEKLAEGAGRIAVFAAAELSRRGRPKKFESLMAPGEPETGEDAYRLACEVRPDLARREAAWYRLAGLHDWAEYEEKYGVRCPVALIETVIRDALEDEEGDLLPFIPLLVQRPDLLTREAEDRLAEELGTWRPWIEADLDAEEAEQAAEGDDEGTLYDLPTDSPVRLFLGLLEVRRPERLREVLDAWLKGKSPGARATARALDRRLDVSKRVGVPILPGQNVDSWLLRRQFERREYSDDPETVEPWKTFDRFCAEGRPLDAVLHVLRTAPDDPDDLALLALTPTKDVLRLLRESRATRNSYWSATFALAIAGDADARAEALGMIRDGRTWMHDRMTDPVALTCAADPEFVAHWVERIESGCCAGWPSCAILGSAFPVLDMPGIVRGRLPTKRHARAALTGVRFVRSHILDAWVPVR